METTNEEIASNNANFEILFALFHAFFTSYPSFPIVAIVISLFALYKSGQTINVYIDKKQMNTVTAENPPANADNK